MFSSGVQHYFDFTRPETINLDRRWTAHAPGLADLTIKIQSSRTS